MIKFGKFEMDCITGIILGFIVLMIILSIWGTKLDIEKEKTKQMEIQYNSNYNNPNYNNEGKEVNNNE